MQRVQRRDQSHEKVLDEGTWLLLEAHQRPGASGSLRGEILDPGAPRRAQVERTRAHQLHQPGAQLGLLFDHPRVFHVLVRSSDGGRRHGNSSLHDFRTSRVLQREASNYPTLIHNQRKGISYFMLYTRRLLL